jgi:hypothetical protein
LLLWVGWPWSEAEMPIVGLLVAVNKIVAAGAGDVAGPYPGGVALRHLLHDHLLHQVSPHWLASSWLWRLKRG